MCLTVPGRVESIDERDPGDRIATVRFGEQSRRAHLIYLPEVKVGEYVIVQAGFAIRRIDESEALQALEYLREGSGSSSPFLTPPAGPAIPLGGGS
jgi:hydrogenase expression/formation protein HypC